MLTIYMKKIDGRSLVSVSLAILLSCLILNVLITETVSTARHSSHRSHKNRSEAKENQTETETGTETGTETEENEDFKYYNLMVEGDGINKRCLQRSGPTSSFNLNLMGGICEDAYDLPRYTYSPSQKRCVMFYWEGCGNVENANMFKTFKECEETCFEGPETCKMKPDQGYGIPDMTPNNFRWYHNKGECYQFLYLGSKGNLNNFESYDSCMKFCNKFDNKESSSEHPTGSHVKHQKTTTPEPELEPEREPEMVSSTVAPASPMLPMSTHKPLSEHLSPTSKVTPPPDYT